MFKVLLLNPPFMEKYSKESRSPCVTKGGTFYYPYWLSYLTGFLEKHAKKNKFEVNLIDAIGENKSKEEILKMLKKYKFDLIIIETSVPSIDSDSEFAKKIKKETNAKILFVGSNLDAYGKDYLKKGLFDFIVYKEWETPTLELIKELQKTKSNLKGIKGLIYREKTKIVDNGPSKLIENLDEIPWVSKVYKKYLPYKKYFYASLQHPMITLLGARGCKYNCSFCPINFKASYRTRSVDDIISEIKWIKQNMSEIKEIMFEDDTFSINKERTKEFCEKMIKNKIKMRWSCNQRVNTDLETLKLMKKAGCRLMCVGFESPSQNVLNNIQKGTTKNLQLEFMKNAKKAGLLVNGCFILGLQGDTKASIEDTIDWAKELSPDTAQFYPLMVYPGTKDFEWAEKNKLLLTKDLSKWITKEGLHTTTIKNANMSPKELVAMCDLARKKFYLRPKYILYKGLQSIKDPNELKRNLIAGKKLFKYLIKGSK